MKNKIIFKSRPEIIVAEQLRRMEEGLKELELTGFDKDFVDQMRFTQKYKLDYPSNSYFSQITDALLVIFNCSDRIHRDILFLIVKDLIDINITDIINKGGDFNSNMELLNNQIMEVFIKGMEMHYYFDEDEVFSSLVFKLCVLLDLDLEDYGFTKEDDQEIY